MLKYCGTGGASGLGIGAAPRAGVRAQTCPGASPQTAACVLAQLFPHHVKTV